MPDPFQPDQSRGVPVGQDRLPPRKADPSALAKLFDEWMQGDGTEQQETFEILRRSLDEDRPVGYKLFP